MKNLFTPLLIGLLLMACDNNLEEEPQPIYAIEGRWLGMPINGAIPGPHSYTYVDGVLTIDLNFGNKLSTPITFDCKGGKVNFVTPGSSLLKLGVDKSCK